METKKNRKQEGRQRGEKEHRVPEIPRQEANRFFFFFFFFCVPQLYLWGSPLLGEIFAYVTVF